MLNGRVGLGTASPQLDAKLEVRGNVRLGNSGSLFATGGPENLRIVRGTVRFANGALSVVSGEGFTVGLANGVNYPITFTQPFSATPTIIVTFEEVANNRTILFIKNVSPTGAEILNGALVDPSQVHIVAIGPR